LQRDESLRFKLHTLKDRLKKASVSWAVFAGAAAHCYGSKRKVTDIDILVKGTDLEKARKALRDIDGVDVVADLKIKVDNETCLFFMDDEMEEKIQRRKLFDVEVSLIPVEDNIIFKAILQRTEKQGKYDIEDIQCMIKNERIDIEYLKKRMLKYHAEKRVKPLLKLLRIL